MGNMNARREYEHGTHIPRAGDIVVKGRVQAEWVARGWAWVEEAWHRVHVDQEQASSGGSGDDAANDAAGLDAVGGDSSGIETGEGSNRNEGAADLLGTETQIETDRGVTDIRPTERVESGSKREWGEMDGEAWDWEREVEEWDNEQSRVEEVVEEWEEEVER